MKRLSTATFVTVLTILSTGLALGEPQLEVVLQSITVEPGIHLEISRVKSAAEPPHDVWIYRPDPMPMGKVGLVVVPPAGGNMLSAPDLGNGDMPEHLPYVRAGFVVVSFRMQGELLSESTDLQFAEAIMAFRSGRAGIDDAESALNFAIRKIDAIDPERIYVAGHSSAATLALLFTAHDSRVQGVAAFAPVLEVLDFVGSEMVEALEEFSAGHREFLKWSSPAQHVDKLTSPVFLFHAKDDQVVPYDGAVAFSEMLRAAGVNLQFQDVATGNHYDSMINVGIPAAIRWMKKLPNR